MERNCSFSIFKSKRNNTRTINVPADSPLVSIEQLFLHDIRSCPATRHLFCLSNVTYRVIVRTKSTGRSRPLSLANHIDHHSFTRAMENTTTLVTSNGQTILREPWTNETWTISIETIETLSVLPTIILYNVFDRKGSVLFDIECNVNKWSEMRLKLFVENFKGCI